MAHAPQAIWTWRRLVAAFALAATLGTVAAYATTVALTISVAADAPSAGTAAGGRVALLTPLDSSFDVTHGKAQVTGGVELYQIDLGKVEWSDEIRIEVYWTNPEDARKVLSNPNSFVTVGVYHCVDKSDGDATLSEALCDGVAGIDTHKDQVDLDQAAGEIFLSQENSGGLLRPRVSNQERLFLLASITVPGGAPPGQQTGQPLEFFANIYRR